MASFAEARGKRPIEVGEIGIGGRRSGGQFAQMGDRHARWLLPIIYLGFISLGLPDGSLGTAWTQLHVSLGLPVGLAGPLLLLATLIGAGSALGSSRVIARFSTGPVVALSATITGAGLLLLANAPGAAWLWAAAALLGLGAGAVDAGLNGFVAKHYTARHMSWLHACWGIGATGGPFIMAAALALASDGWRLGYLVLAGIQLGLAALFFSSLRLWRRAPEIPRTQHRADAGPGDLDAVKPPRARANSGVGHLSALLFAIYVGVEVMAGLWIATFLVLERGATPAIAGVCVTAYYAAITAVRILNGFVVDRIGNRRMVTGALWLGLVGALGLLTLEPLWLSGLSLILLGLGISVVYPGMMHEVTHRFVPEDAQTMIGRQNSAAYLGSAILPITAGWFVQEVSAWVVPITILVGVIFLQVSVWWLDRTS